MIFETFIENFKFRYNGENIIEVSKRDDRFGTVIYEINTGKPLECKKDFDKECFFWYFDEAKNFS